MTLSELYLNEAVSDSQMLHWMNKEIPAWLDKFNSYEKFSEATKGAAASFMWKNFAFAMAKERWKVSYVEKVPS